MTRMHQKKKLISRVVPGRVSFFNCVRSTDLRPLTADRPLFFPTDVFEHAEHAQLPCAADVRKQIQLDE